MLASILPNVYVDKEWVANENLRRCKCGAWKEKKYSGGVEMLEFGMHH
jgi:hypothetical protein